MAEIAEKVAALRAAYDVVAACDIDALTRDELLAFGDDLQALSNALPTQWHRLLTRLKTQTHPKWLGAKTWNEVLRVRWRLSTTAAGRRLADAEHLGPRQAFTGAPLPPDQPAIAAAQSLGLITGEMVTLIRDMLRKIPARIDDVTRSQVEGDLVRIAVGGGYDELRTAAALRLLLLDQDGPEPDLEARDRKRGAALGDQGPDLMTEFRATLTPEAAAIYEVLFAKYSAPGMCNPADPEPCTSGTPSRAQIDNDHRTRAQRQHDALVAIGRIALMSDLGTLNGLPVSVIIRTTVADLESRGIVITGGGTLMTTSDLDRLGGHAAYHLAVFDGKTGSALNHFRSKRVATAAQRIMLIAQHGVGCTKPGCTVDAYGVQAHHAVADWADDGQTNVDELAPACGGDNNLVDKNGGYTTAINEHGHCEWIPPEHLDTGQRRTNILHRPEALLTPDDDTSPAVPTLIPPPAPPAPPVPDDQEPLDIGDVDAPPPEPDAEPPADLHTGLDRPEPTADTITYDPTASDLVGPGDEPPCDEPPPDAPHEHDITEFVRYHASHRLFTSPAGRTANHQPRLRSGRLHRNTHHTNTTRPTSGPAPPG